MRASLQTQLLHSLKQHHSAVQRKRAHPCSRGLGAGSDERSEGDFVRFYTIFRHVVKNLESAIQRLTKGRPQDTKTECLSLVVKVPFSQVCAPVQLP